jgi:two-component system response regulator AtoC
MKLLVVDDEQGLRHTLSLILRGEGHDVVTASDGGAALSALAEDRAIGLVLCDVRMPVMDGMTFLERYRESGGAALVIMMSAYGDDDAAIAAIQRGAYDFIPKPFRPEQVLLVVRKAIEREGLRHQVEQLHAEVEALRGGDGIIGRSTALRDVVALALKVARHPSTVLVTGESGTGKELVARLIHRASPRGDRAFVAVNCGAIPEALLESELFGHVKGAFTGATNERRGLFEEASGGTLFLDEIGELPPALQVKLLRALQEGQVRRVGDSADRPVDVRVIAATSRNLEQEVGASRFRADLYYRLNVVRLHLPPLRARPEDIPDLVAHFLAQYNTKLGLSVGGVAPAAMRRLVDYPWPGNVRELENTIERALILTETPQIEPDALHLGAGDRNGGGIDTTAAANGEVAADGDLSIKRQTATLERALIERALAQTGGNRTRAARLLQLSHRALLYKIREYGLDT